MDEKEEDEVVKKEDEVEEEEVEEKVEARVTAAATPGLNGSSLTDTSWPTRRRVAAIFVYL